MATPPFTSLIQSPYSCTELFRPFAIIVEPNLSARACVANLRWLLEGARPFVRGYLPEFEFGPLQSSKLWCVRFFVGNNAVQNLGLCRGSDARLRRSRIIKAMDESASFLTKNCLAISGKSTLACALSLGLHSRGKLTYILDGDNVRHSLNRDLGFKAEDRAENIRRIGEVAMLFADAGVIYRDGCRALLPPGDFIEVFMDVPLQLCEARDPKGLYRLARAGKIEGFTGINDPYEPPLNCEVVLKQKEDDCVTPCNMAETVISYLEERGYQRA